MTGRYPMVFSEYEELNMMELINEHFEIEMSTPKWGMPQSLKGVNTAMPGFSTEFMTC